MNSAWWLLLITPIPWLLLFIVIEIIEELIEWTNREPKH